MKAGTDEIIERLVTEGLASLERHEKRSEHLEGGRVGFLMCRRLRSRRAFEETLAFRHEEERRLTTTNTDAVTYWRYRAATIQIEFVFERLKVFWGDRIVSARAAQHVRRMTKQQ